MSWRQWKEKGKGKGPAVEDSWTVSLSMSSQKGWFMAKARYSEKLNAAYRNAGGRFDKDAQAWLLPIRKYTMLQQLLRKVKICPPISIDPIPPFVMKHATGAVKSRWAGPAVTDESSHTILQHKVPGKLLKAMRPFQRIGAATAVSRGGRMLIGDEMGLGKTIQALAVAMYFSSEWPLLVICPSSLRHTWSGEIGKWLGIGEENIQIITAGKQKPSNLICIISFDLATRMAEKLNRFKVVVVDESHYLKSADSKRTKALMPLIKSASRVLLLSGTPALSRPIELFTQLHSMLPETFRTATAFGKRYCNGFQGAYGWDFTGSSNLEELHWLMAETVMIRRLKKDVLKELPAKIRQQVFLEPTAQYKKEFVGLKKQQATLDSKIRGSSGTTRQSLENAKRNLTVKMYQETGKAKIVNALSYLDELSAKGIKALLFAHHRDVLDAMMLHLAKRKLKSIRIDGETPQQTRQMLCTQFQTDEATRFAVLSITAAGVGLTLHAAQTVVFFELFWNPGQLLQAQDRAHRLGQKHVVDIKYLICKGTIDDTIWALIDQKLQVVGSAVSGTRDKLDIAPEKVTTDDENMVEDDEDPVEKYMAAAAAVGGGGGSAGSSVGAGAGGSGVSSIESTFNPPDFEDDDVDAHEIKRCKTTTTMITSKLAQSVERAGLAHKTPATGHRGG